MESNNSDKQSLTSYVDEFITQLVHPAMALYALTAYFNILWYDHKRELEDLLGRRVNEEDKAVFFNQLLDAYLVRFSHVPFNRKLKRKLDNARIRRFARELEVYFPGGDSIV